MGLTAGFAIFSATTTAATAYSQSQAEQAQGEYQSSMYKINSQFARLQARDAIRRGDKAAEDAKRQGKQVIGAQRAAFAAQGIEVDSGSALEVQQDTAQQAALDALKIRNNAWREAWGYKQEAAQASAQGRFAQIASNTNARNTLLTGGFQAATQAFGVYNTYKGRTR